MKRLSTLWQALTVIGCLFLGLPAQAASSSEERAWKTAQTAFADAREAMGWWAAEGRFSDFIKKYPNSDHYADAVVYEARALYEQQNYDQVIATLSAQAPHAGKAADAFAYWTAKAYFQKTNYTAAADTFARLIRENPTSNLRLEATFREAEAHARLEYWRRVIEELGEPDGAFQRMAKTNRNDDLVVSGMLLLSQAQLAQKEYAAAEKTLAGLDTRNLRGELEWERQYLLSRVQLASGQARVALDASTNLLSAAIGRPELKARSILLQGDILEQLEQFPEAIQLYETNLNDLPAVHRREALLKVVELMLRQNKTEAAAQRLDDYLGKHLEEKGADLELLILGELRLRESYRAATNSAHATNLLQAATADFQKLIQNFANSDYLGKAELNLGWCYLAADKIPESLEVFSNAVTHLKSPEDQAVTRFKLGDILYQRKDYAGAILNYTAIVDKSAPSKGAKDALAEKALYQILRAYLVQTNLTAATDTLHKILEWFPSGIVADRGMLLVGQSQNPTYAREIFSDFSMRFADSPLLPEVKLAIGRTYEQEGNWSAAVSQYNDWVNTYTNSPILARAEFERAWATAEAGSDTNAFMLFTNFVARFATNPVASSEDLAAKAQHWIGDFYWRQGDSQKAELSYKEIFTKWPDSRLAFEARMMAGRAAMDSQNPQAAIAHFSTLAANPNCPPDLKAQALYASGDATMELPSTTTQSNYQDAISFFRSIVNTYTNTTIAAKALGRLGDCYYALAAGDASRYETASNAFATVMDSPLADITTRSLAEFRLAQTLEAMSQQAGTNKKLLLKLTLDHLLNVFYGTNLRDNESPDLFWVKESGIKAAAVVEGMGEWAQAVQYYQKLQKIVPPLQSALDKKITRAKEHLAADKIN